MTTFATADALAKLLIEKGLITQEEFMEKLSATDNISEASKSHPAIASVDLQQNH